MKTELGSGAARGNAGFRLTDKDRQLLLLLQRNAREPAASLARKIGVSRSTLQERIQRLETAGVISGYTVKLRTGKLINGVECFTFVSCNNKVYSDIVRQLKAMDSIQAIHSVSGDWDFLIQVCADSLEKMNGELNKINAINGVEKTSSNIVMETRYDRRASRVDETLG